MQAQQHPDHHANQGDGAVLTVKIGVGAFLNSGGDFLHALGSSTRRKHRTSSIDAIEQRQNAARNH